MPDRLEKISGDFIYTEADILSGIQFAQDQLAGFQSDLSSPDASIRDWAHQCLPQFLGATQYAQQHTSSDMLTELRNVHDTVKRLHTEGVPELEVGRRINQRYGEQVGHYRVYLRQTKGWIESLGQLMYAASLREE